MKIVIFNWQDRTHPQAGGAETHLHEIFSRLVKRGHSVTLVACAYDGAPSTEVIDGITVIRIGSRATYNFAVPIWWLRHGKHLGYDLVVDDINKIPVFTPLFVGLPVLALVHHLFGSAIFSEAGAIAGTYVWLSERLIPRIYRDTPIAVVSESTRRDCIESGLSERQLDIVYNGVAVEHFPMRVSEKEAVPTIAYFGRLKKYKSVDHVIKAMRIVVQRLPEARLDVLGRGDDEPRLRALVAEEGLADNVTFHGYVNDQTKVRLLSRAHVVVNPSMKEGWGITNLEANACGTPVISADSPGLRDSVSNGVSGLLYPYGDIELLAQRIVSVVSDAHLSSTLQEGSLVWARQFSWDRSSIEMEALCRRAISR
jgi:glycosyltransferase involved in cell wall biosynthesis